MRSFLSGIGGSVPSIGSGILADCWRPDERGRSLSFYYFFPLIGPAVGSIIGAFITEYTSWHWMFYSTSILGATVQILSIFALPETYGPTILHWRAKRLKCSTGNSQFHTEYEELHKSVADVLMQALVRPCKLLGTQPIVQALAIFIAYIYGLMYLALSTFPSVWVNIYKQRIDIAGLNYISLAFGFCLATQLGAPISDFVRQLQWP